MITIFGVMFFFVFKVLTYETNSPEDYLTDIQIGSATKRWQAAYELSILLSSPDMVPTDQVFKNKMLSIYEHSIHDAPKVRTYMALAMGRTGQQEYGPTLIQGMNDRDQVSRLAAIKALGLLAYAPAINEIQEFTGEKYSSAERLAATIALGSMRD